MANVLSLIRKTDNTLDFSGMLKMLEAECRTCTPLSPLECISRCRVYALKNELRCLRKNLDSPNYLKELFNVLKNETRLCILQVVVNGRYSVSQLQKELKEAGNFRSQDNLNRNYLRPLMAVGLVSEEQEQYYATSFGDRIAKLIGCFPEFAEKLSAHSECFEETVLQFLLSGPKTFKDIKAVISPKITSRILKRLHSGLLIKTSKEREYIFFFKTIRDPKKETLTPTERKIYNAIADRGISAGKLAEQTGFSLRIIYKYLRRLRGKKLVFIRKTPKTYSLTFNGEKLALILEKLHQTVEDTWDSSQQVIQDSQIILGS